MGLDRVVPIFADEDLASASVNEDRSIGSIAVDERRKILLHHPLK